MKTELKKALEHIEVSIKELEKTKMAWKWEEKRNYSRLCSARNEIKSVIWDLQGFVD